MQNDREHVHTRVADAYAKAVTGQGGACCRPSGNEGVKGVAAQWAGYNVADTKALPQEAVVNSFGCGNPLAFAEVQPGQVVLDLGSGAGLDLLIAGQAVGPEGKVIGVDMTDAMLLEARENIARAGLAGTVEVRKGIIEDLPVDDSSVDWVISNCVINLSPEKNRVFAEIHRVLKPGGRMRVSDLVVEDLPDWVRADEALYSSCIAGAIPEAEYLTGLRDAGLEDVRTVDRLAYDRRQIRTLIASDLEDEGSGCGCGCGNARLSSAEQVDRASRELDGKVVSAVITAQKP